MSGQESETSSAKNVIPKTIARSVPVFNRLKSGGKGYFGAISCAIVVRQSPEWGALLAAGGWFEAFMVGNLRQVVPNLGLQRMLATAFLDKAQERLRLVPLV